MGRRWRTLTTLVVFVPAALVLGSTSALAECTGSIFFPPFRQAIVTADSVVIGTVVKNYNEDRGQPGLTSHFKVQVDETLRGPSRSSVEIDDLRALKGGCVANLVVRVGWQIAIASDASVPGVPGRLTAVAYLNHDPDRFKERGIPRLTAQEVRTLAALPDTSTATSDPSMAASGVPTDIFLAVVLLVSMVGVLRVMSRRIDPHPQT